jgi:DNA-binding transcriptional ArsR family regulator
MPRAATTLDPFNAVAEPKRRQVLDMLAKGERPVNELVKSLGWPQPQVSKHLGVLRKVGLVTERREGRQRVYKLNGERLRPIHEWVKDYERFWKHQLARIKARAEQKRQDF